MAKFLSLIKTLKLMPKMLNLRFFLKYMYSIFRFTHNSFFWSIWHLHFIIQTGIATSLSVIEQYFLALCTQNFVTLDDKLWPRQSCKVNFFGTHLLSDAETIMLHLGSRNFVCTISIHITTHRKKYCSSTLREVAISIWSPVWFSAGCTFCPILTFLTLLTFLTD